MTSIYVSEAKRSLQSQVNQLKEREKQVQADNQRLQQTVVSLEKVSHSLNTRTLLSDIWMETRLNFVVLSNE